MSLKRETISWLLVTLLGFMVVYQYLGSNRAEARAEAAEQAAKQLDAKFADFVNQSEKREAAAQARYEASLAEGAQLRAILSKGSQAAPKTPPTAIPSHSEPVQEALKAIPPSQGPEPATKPCDEFIYQGSPLIIEGFQVLVCDAKPVVQAEAAVALHDKQALVDKLTVQVSETTAKLELQGEELNRYKAAEAQWKKAAKKSRIKRIVRGAGVVAIAVGSFYLGRKF